MAWKILGSKIVHKSKWINLYKEKIRIKKNLVVDDYYKIIWKDAVIILPVINKKILILRSYKKALDTLILFHRAISKRMRNL